MTLERILEAAKNSMIAGTRTPHCYRAHVPGQGYVNDGSRVDHVEEFKRQLARDVQSEIDNMNFARDYAEPGYTTPDKGILFANWNKFPRNFDRVLERAGYAVEWNDEWSICDCGKAVRTSPDSHGWTPSYALVNDCELICAECLADSPDSLIEELNGNADRCLSADLHRSIDLAEYGYTPLAGAEYESGLHPGQTDNPRAIAKELRAKGIDDFIFVQTDQGQFDVRFTVYVRTPESEESESAE